MALRMSAAEWERRGIDAIRLCSILSQRSLLHRGLAVSAYRKSFVTCKGWRFAAIFLLAFPWAVLHSQILHSSERASFEVAIIKPSSAGETQFSMGFTDGGRGFQATNATVRDMIQEAWNVKSANQIQGVSGWVSTERFDIEARMTDAKAQSLAALPLGDRISQVRLMRQSLLEERCGLKMHSSTRESTFFELLPAKGGPKLKPTRMIPADAAMGAQAHPAAGPRIQRRGPGQVEATDVSMSMLTDFLGRLTELGSNGGFSVGELIVDKTGLSGVYDWTLNWMPQSTAGSDASLNAAGPSLYTALEEQLGLQLKKTKGPVEVLVIDHVERPSGN